MWTNDVSSGAGTHSIRSKNHEPKKEEHEVRGGVMKEQDQCEESKKVRWS